jgi:SAM-dependent methyltransferase
MERAELAVVATDWKRLIEEIGIPLDGPLLVVGRGRQVAEAIQMAGARATLTVDPPAVIGEAGIEVTGGTASATGLPDGSVAGVVALAAWPDVRALRSVVDEAVRVTRPGGVVVLGEVDREILTEGPPGTFTASAFYRAHPEAVPGLRRAASLAALALDAVRTGLHDVGTMTADRLLAVFRTREEYVEAVNAGLWRGADRVADEERTATLERIMESLAPPFEDRQPWVFVRGTVA